MLWKLYVEREEFWCKEMFLLAEIFVISELLVPGAKLYRSDFLSALRAMSQYFHHQIST